VLNGAGSNTGTTGNGTSSGPSLADANAGLLNQGNTGSNNAGGTDGLVGGQVGALNPNSGSGGGSGGGAGPGGGNGGGNGGGGNGVPVTASLNVDTQGGGPLASADADHSGGVPGQTNVDANVNLGPAITPIQGALGDAGDTLTSTANSLTNNLSNITNNAGNTFNTTNTTTGQGNGLDSLALAGGGGGGVEIGGFSGAYNEDWRLRCDYVLHHWKEYKKQKIWYRCRDLVKKEDKKKHSRQASKH
jgi:hypothetical protein